MSDSFADLWNTTAPKTTPAAPKLGSAVSQQQQPQRTRPDVFAMLSSAGTSAPNSRPLTPLAASPRPGASPKPPSLQPSSSGDAFSSLFSGTNSVKSPTQSMTMAERAAKAEQDRLRSVTQASQPKRPSVGDAWSGLDSLGGLAGRKPPQSIPTASHNEDDWGLGDFGSVPPATTTNRPKPPPQKTASKGSLWDIDDFAGSGSAGDSLLGGDDYQPARKTTPPPPSRTRATNSGALWDLEGFAGPPSPRASVPPPEEDDDDVLGALGRPPSPPPLPSRQPRSAKPTPNRSASPPPHILGQIVEMGFSVQQARVALAATDTGLDVEAALENLLSNGAAGPRASSSSPPPQSQQAPPPRRRAPPRALDASPPPSNEQQGVNTDEIIARASEIGLSFFNKASAAWKEGKQRAAKVYQEKLAEQSNAGRPPPSASTGRPKWMTGDWNDGEDESGVPTARPGKAFREREDLDDDAPDTPRLQSRPKPRQQEPPSLAQQTANLFSDEPAAPQVYRSRFRHGTPSSASSPAPVATPPPRQPTPPPPRPTVTASSSAISASQQHKATGTEKFKLGQFADAESSYSRAIDCLPERHNLLIPLYTNRSLARLKTGEYGGAIADADVAIAIIGVDWRPSVHRSSVEDGVDLGDALLKAWKRRAEALEGREKWTEAKQDWEKVAGSSWASTNLRNDGVRGVGRCRNMLTPKPKAEAVAPSKPKARPKREIHLDASNNAALAKLQKDNQAADAEDQAKHDLKDTVDAKLLAWKGGKETNIRALLGSLDTVLWPEIGVPKSNMSELITPAQVKIRYMKTIAKLHPDKLSSSNSTLEQKMVANGVFGALNEAWNAFK